MDPQEELEILHAILAPAAFEGRDETAIQIARRLVLKDQLASNLSRMVLEKVWGYETHDGFEKRYPILTEVLRRLIGY